MAPRRGQTSVPARNGLLPSWPSPLWTFTRSEKPVWGSLAVALPQAMEMCMSAMPFPQHPNLRLQRQCRTVDKYLEFMARKGLPALIARQRRGDNDGHPVGGLGFACKVHRQVFV